MNMESLLKKYNITNWEYNLYQGTIQQFRIDAKYINNESFVYELDNSKLDIGCILTFSKPL